MIVLCYGAFGLILVIKSHAVGRQAQTSRTHMKVNYYGFDYLHFVLIVKVFLDFCPGHFD